MKRVLALLLTVCILMSFTGCDALDYKKAMDHYNAGEYAQALEIYRALGDFADSAAMAEICWQKADYEAAEQLFNEGSYRQALELYQGLNMYMDSPIKAIACQYRIGLGCIDAGAYEEALTWLEPLGSYEDALQQVSNAKWLWLCTAIESNGGQLEVPAGTAGGSVFLRNDEGGTIEVAYENTGLLLGVPFESKMVITVTQDVREAPYAASYVSSSTSKIEEIAEGTVDVALFTATANIPVETFSQTNTDPDGGQIISTDTTDALMMEIILAEAKNAIAEGLPKLVEQSGTAVTLTDLGFVSLER